VVGADGPLLIRELEDDVKVPRSTGRRVGAAAHVVIGQSGVHVGREADIEVGVGIGTSENFVLREF
jgi:hypothetical protein